MTRVFKDSVSQHERINVSLMPADVTDRVTVAGPAGLKTVSVSMVNLGKSSDWTKG